MVDKIIIYETEYPVKFGKGAIQKFSEKNGIDSLDGFIKYLKDIKYDKMEYNTIDQFAFLLECGIEMGYYFSGKEGSVDIKILSEWLTQDIVNMPTVLNMVIKSLPLGDKKKEPKGEMKE